jgi:polysaccharide deacetylase 2 family uncharacterized protein YibQ
VSKWPWLKVFAGFSAVIFLVSLGYRITDHKTAVPPSARLSEVLPAVESDAIVKKERLQDPSAALVWLLEALSASEPELAVTESSRVMYNGRLSWKRVLLQGISSDIENLAAVLEASRKTLIQEFNYQLLLSCEPGRGNLSFLMIDGFEVVVVANFIAAGLKSASKPESRLPQLAIVIDDLGRSLESAADFAALDIPLTFAVFPKLSESRAVAEYFTSRQRDILLHMPMEPRDYPAQDPGPGAVFMAMNDHEVRQIFCDDIESVPGIIGVNNHMGSRLTADPQKMSQIMATLRGRDLFFLDSRTIADSVAYKSAVKAGIPALQRDVFLDNDRNIDNILEQFRVLIEIARVKGEAIGIGHPYPETLQALSRVAEIAESAGVEIVPVRKFLHPALTKLPGAGSLL